MKGVKSPCRRAGLVTKPTCSDHDEEGEPRVVLGVGITERYTGFDNTTVAAADHPPKNGISMPVTQNTQTCGRSQCTAAACSPALRVIDIDPLTDQRWRNFVAAHVDGLVYHHPAWLHVLADAYGGEPLGLACVDGEGRLQGIMPLLYRRTLLVGGRLSSLPYTAAAGPLVSRADATPLLLRAAVDRTELGSWLQVKASSSLSNHAIDGLVGQRWEQTYIVDLPDDVDQLRFRSGRNHRRIRRGVRRATSLGVQVREAETVADLQRWYCLYLETMRWQAIPPRPYRFFASAWHVLRPIGLLRLLLAEQVTSGHRVLLAGSIFLAFGQTIVTPFGGWSRENQHLRPNDVIDWYALHEACQAGFRRVDFGEVAAQNLGLAAYERKWGAQPRWLWRYYYPAPHGLERFQFGYGASRWPIVKRLWRHMPLGMTATLGEQLYRHI